MNFYSFALWLIEISSSAVFDSYFPCRTLSLTTGPWVSKWWTGWPLIGPSVSPPCLFGLDFGHERNPGGNGEGKLRSSQSAVSRRSLQYAKRKVSSLSELDSVVNRIGPRDRPWHIAVLLSQSTWYEHTSRVWKVPKEVICKLTVLLHWIRTPSGQQNSQASQQAGYNKTYTFPVMTHV